MERGVESIECVFVFEEFVITMGRYNFNNVFNN